MFGDVLGTWTVLLAYGLPSVQECFINLDIYIYIHNLSH